MTKFGVVYALSDFVGSGHGILDGLPLYMHASMIFIICQMRRRNCFRSVLSLLVEDCSAGLDVDIHRKILLFVCRG